MGSAPTPDRLFFPSRSVFRLIILGLLFAAALALRAYKLKEVPLQFHPIRQYHSAFIARQLYYRSAKSIPEWKKQIAACNRKKEATMEPLILEHLATLAYRLVGRERLWIPRLFSSLFWLIGGAFLYLLAKNMLSADAALFSTTFYLLLPFGVIASRTFQPDPMMVMMLMASVYAIFLDHAQPSRHRWTMALISSALAILIKPMCWFAIFGAFVSLAIHERGFWTTIKRPRAWSFASLALLPSLIFYSYGVLKHLEILYIAENTFLPHHLGERVYWLGWLDMIDRVAGSTAFIVALLGVLLLRGGRLRVLLAGLWTGYFIFCLVFNDAIYTHDYYHLQLIPVVALSLGPVADTVLKHLENRPGMRPVRRVASVSTLILVAFLATTFYLRAIWRPLNQIDRDPVTIAQEIGQRVGHTSRCLCLSYAYGVILEYHGDLCGIPWPGISDLLEERRGGQLPLTVEERYKELAQNYSPEYFIVTDLGELKEQPELRDFLNKNFPLLSGNDRYLIFDLRTRLLRKSRP